MRRRYKLMAAATFMIAGALIAGATQPAEPAPPEPAPVPDVSHIDTIPAEIVAKRLAEAEEASQRSLFVRIHPVRSLFSRGRGGASIFARAALSWRAKWAVVKGVFDGESRDDFMETYFNQFVLDPTKLQQAIDLAFRTYSEDLDRIEAEMLVKLQVDIADRPLVAMPAVRTDGEYAIRYRALAVDVSRKMRDDFVVSVGSEVASQVAGQVAANFAIRAASELGLRGEDEPSTLTQIGTGVVASLVIDYAMDKGMKKAGYNPEEQITQSIYQALDKLEDSLVGLPSGTRQKSGVLLAEMQRIHKSRTELRAAVVNQMCKGGVE